MKLNLKKIYIFPIVAACGILTSSCNDFLDREPISEHLPLRNTFNSAEELGAYAINYYTSLIATNDVLPIMPGL